MSTDTPTSTTQTPTPLGRRVRFLSDKEGLRLIRQDWGEVHMPNGNVRKDPAQPEISYQFNNHALEVREGQDILADKVDPETGEVVPQDAVEYIRGVDWFGTHIHEVPKDADAPDPAPLYAEIARLAVQRDVEGLKALGDEEHTLYGREFVLDAIRAALQEIDPPPEAA